jgi:glutamate dehydrogenase
VALMETLEERGLLNRDVEFLPSDTLLAERGASGKGLTRPEIAVLLAYAKNALYADLLESDVTDDLYLSRELYRYFPPTLVETFRAAVTGHRLRREVIATVLANAMINRGGPAFVNEIISATSADAGQVAAAYAAARDSFGLIEINARIDALDATVPGLTQVRLYAEVEALVTRETLWFLRNESFEDGLAPLIERHREGIAAIRTRFADLVTPWIVESIETRTAALEQAGAPHDVAHLIAELSPLSMASDIVLVATKSGSTVVDAATAFFGILDAFRLGSIIEAGNRIVLADRFDRMALDRALANLMRAVRDLTLDVLASSEGPVAARLIAWHDDRPKAIDRATLSVRDLTEGDITVSRLSVAAGLLADLARSA